VVAVTVDPNSTRKATENWGDMDTTGTAVVCGAGKPCEQTCPVMRMGRICPDLPEFIDELAGLFTPGLEAPQLEPELA
jgi:hypothetical protein